ncbi:hypothetical protein GP486_004371 [Trichoglossum hirsutum]|uniref:NAD(P)-binding domain-containing protein n=1 Tax=Trichoglossum hirsutum TaxID=265104 RepID=A0A9P8LB42_9PEZI|nr:hypothetical protein GP486_004371 [Trichoglossum hirsutum]
MRSPVVVAVAAVGGVLVGRVVASPFSVSDLLSYLPKPSLPTLQVPPQLAYSPNLPSPPSGMLYSSPPPPTLVSPASPLLRRSLDVGFKYQSQSIRFSEWLSLLTLCLAPLIAHLFVGVVEPTSLSGRIPWYQRICHYNPTSIAWRYFAITDRRCRAKGWTQRDLAATNAVFWDGSHWDGSQKIMIKKRDSATKVPDSHRVSLISKSVFQTLIVSLQGVQAIYVVAFYSRAHRVAPGHPISVVFYPLAVLGLLRLPAALWLTDEYGYREGEDPEPQKVSDGVELDQLPLHVQVLAMTGSFRADDDDLSWKFHSQGSRRGIAVRVAFLGTWLVLFVMAVLFTAQDFRSGVKNSLSTFASQVFYLFLIACTISFMSVYILRGRGNTTVIPCIETPIYKAYTYFLILLAVGFTVICGLETRRTTCGLYTTNPIDWGLDDVMCASYTTLYSYAPSDNKRTMHIILTGATGTVGSPVLTSLLASPLISQLSILSRRQFDLPTGDNLDPKKAKIIVHDDYVSYPEELLKGALSGAQGCIWAQGISQNEVNKEDYIRITYDFPMAAARAFATLSKPGGHFNFVYVSGEGADTTEKTFTFFGRIKGRAERDLLSLPTSDPSLSSLRIFNVRPGYVEPSPLRGRSFPYKVADCTLLPVMRRLSPGRVTPGGVLAKVLTDLATGDGEPLTGSGVEAEGRTLRSPGIRRLGDDPEGSEEAR